MLNGVPRLQASQRLCRLLAEPVDSTDPYAFKLKSYHSKVQVFCFHPLMPNSVFLLMRKKCRVCIRNKGYFVVYLDLYKINKNFGLVFCKVPKD